jgi:hypothetical protein
MLFRPEIVLYDQAVHMWLLYTLDWGSWLSKLPDGLSPVATLAIRDQIRFSYVQVSLTQHHQTLPIFLTFAQTTTGDVQVLNDDGTTPCVVHQYDR